MSRFLGKIHYWLFNKILWFENLEHKIVEWAEKEGRLPVLQWQEEIQAAYGSPLPDKPLEEMIDTDNIHGWLQDKISRAELRQAAWITKILNYSAAYKQDLVKLYEEQGYYAGSEAGKEAKPEYPEEVFNLLNDFLLEGMPCDRVNQELENNGQVYKWTATACLHQPYWEEAGGDVSHFYELRDAWIRSFVKGLGEDFVYNVEEQGGRRIHQIKKVSS